MTQFQRVVADGAVAERLLVAGPGRVRFGEVVA